MCTVFNTVEFYNSVISSISTKLNPLSLARIASLIAANIASADYEAAIALLQSVTPGNAAAETYLESKLAMRMLCNPSVNADALEGVRKILQKSKQRLTTHLDDGVDKEGNGGGGSGIVRDLAQVSSLTSGSELALVYSAYYEASMLYRKHVGPPDAFYKDALLYLSYTKVDDIPDAYTLATDLSLAALTGEVFHFGEVVTSIEILKVLEGTPNAWLMELMQCCAQGDVEKFLQITAQPQVQTQINAQPAFIARAYAVKEKITLLSLVNLVFERPAHERNISFEDIVIRCKLTNSSEVEMLVMRALSLGLIRGSMDQVEGIVFVHWVMPRVLDNAQMSALGCRFGEWAVKSSKVADYMTDHATNI